MSEEVKNERPEEHSPGWSDWVLAQLEDNELTEGHPKALGLARVAKKLYGPFSIIPDVMQCPQADNHNRATVRTIITWSNTGLSYGGCADVCNRNCDPPFSNYPVASAETRALGRALRLALGINKATAEELSDKAEEIEEEDDGKYITSSQIRAIDNLCGRYNINVRTYVLSHNNKAETISDVTLKQAAKMMKDIQKYQQGTEVPSNLLGYVKAWREEFGESK